MYRYSIQCSIYKDVSEYDPILEMPIPNTRSPHDEIHRGEINLKSEELTRDKVAAFIRENFEFVLSSSDFSIQVEDRNRFSVEVIEDKRGKRDTEGTVFAEYVMEISLTEFPPESAITDLRIESCKHFYTKE